MLAKVDPRTTVAPEGAAEAAGLVYVSTDEPGIGRRRAGKGFVYNSPSRERIADAETVRRIRALAIPPAWKTVWICVKPKGHIQAIGYDDNGRKQYLYHHRFREVREGVKFDHILIFAQALPALRRRIAADMRVSGLGRDKVLATVVQLLEATMIRVGNRAYAKENRSYGLTTLRSRHVQIEGGDLKFHFKGKSGKVWRLGLYDRRVAKILKACQDLPGQDLFQYLDGDGERRAVTSTDINAYLKRVSGRDITAKDFRTWAGTVLAAIALVDGEPPGSPTQAKKRLGMAMGLVAARLGNTPAICRKCYVHPEILNAYLEGSLRLGAAAAIDLAAEEAAVLHFLRRRLKAPGSVIPGPWPPRKRRSHE